MKIMKVFIIYLLEKGAKSEPKGVKQKTKGATIERKGSQGEPKVSHMEA